MIKKYLENNILVTDGAMGTYFSQLDTNNILPEMTNIKNRGIIKKIHQEYIQAGAQLIRTNTFSANTYSLKSSRDELKEIINKGYDIAKEAAEGEEVFIAADIGPIPEMVDNKEINRENIIEEYKFIVDTFIDKGAQIFIFETFSSTDYLEPIARYIKEQDKDTFILTQFVIMQDGFTRKGIKGSRIIEQVKKIDCIDAFGFNCGTGPTHLYNSIKSLDLKSNIISALPNAGFPQVVNERTMYNQNVEYFAEAMDKFRDLGVKIIGGCCGTTPAHIKRITERIYNITETSYKKTNMVEREVKTNKEDTTKLEENKFKNKLDNNEFVVAIELDPPFDNNVEKIMSGAKILKENGADIITIADSPLGRARVNAMVAAAKIKREVGIDVIPHICCRDRNTIALKSDLLAAYVEDVRNILVVTGDPVPVSEIKSVFNLNSMKLMSLIDEMNKELFDKDPYFIGGALNLNVPNKDAEVARMYKKAENGANFFLTQPIYDKEVVDYLRSMKRQRNIKILGGIMPIVSYRNAQFLNNEVPGIKIPNEYILRFNEDMTREAAEEIGIEIAVDIASRIKEHVDGFYFMTPFNRFNMISKILKEVL